MVMGYFRAPKKRGSRKKNVNSEEAGALREALLEQPAGVGGEGDGGVPKGYFAVYVGEEEEEAMEPRRFVVPTGYLREPAFRELMERAADEFGFAQAAGLRVPCALDDFEDLLRRLRCKNNGKKKPIS